MTTPAEQLQYPFDTRPLTEPVDQAAVKQFTKEMRRKYGISVLTEIILWAVFVGFMLLMLVWTLARAVQDSPELVSNAALILAPLAVGIGAVSIVIAVLKKPRATAYRIAQFAAANGMTYLHEVKDPPLPGMIFQQGRSRKASMLVRGEHPRFVEFGNYEYEVGSRKTTRTYFWGYVAVKLTVPLPNIVLDALGNNSLGTNLPSSFSKSQRLSLEGDFDRHFTLYCPNGYEADALYLFTPDVMARFIDKSAQMDVEIVDDWMFLYTRRPASTTDAATWAWLFSTVGALMTKFDQWERWRDDRLRQAPVSAPQHPTALPPVPGTATPAAVLPFAAPAGALAPPPGVAPEGRRLKRRISWVVILGVAAILLAQVIPSIVTALSTR